MGTRYKLDYLRPQAYRLAEYLAPTCETIIVAGSIRREREEVGDVELVAVPRFRTNLFGEARDGESELAELLAREYAAAHFRRVRGLHRYQRFEVMTRDGGVCFPVDLWMVPAEELPVATAIRTGPAAFSKSIVSTREKGGVLQNGLRITGNRVVDGATGEALGVDTEREFFERYTSCGWIDPPRRG